jgi:cell wall-associated NlpC family hydrolase
MIVGISAWARKYVGIRFAKRGRGFDGVDCYGLHWLVEKTEAGRDLPLLDYAFEPRDVRGISQLFNGEMPLWRRLDAPQDRCVVMLLTGGVASHVGVVCGDGLIIHADSDAGMVVCERLSAPSWPESRIEGFYAYGGGA